MNQVVSQGSLVRSWLIKFGLVSSEINRVFCTGRVTMLKDSQGSPGSKSPMIAQYQVNVSRIQEPGNGSPCYHWIKRLEAGKKSGESNQDITHSAKVQHEVSQWS